MKICVVGLGYVGLPLAAKFGQIMPVNGFDINIKRIEELNEGVDKTKEVEHDELVSADINFSFDPSIISESDFIIIAVPTPIDDAKLPDLRPLLGATKLVGKNMKKGAIVVYESTVYPGCTEEKCVPILEKESGLKYNDGFKVGYSPERINPGDKVHNVDTIVKVVSGSDDYALEKIADTYGKIIRAGVYKASSIRVAEAAKVIENVQRDLNIALMNELALIFDRMGLETLEVLKAAGTKWNFLKFYPGLVGGHCIGVDPYYLTHKAKMVGYHPEVILSGRRINDSMAEHIAQRTVQLLIKADKKVKGSRVLVMGLTFKENVNDVRNSKVKDIIGILKKYYMDVIGCDPNLSCGCVLARFGIEKVDFEDAIGFDAIILAVPHDEYKNLDPDVIKDKCNGCPIFVDVKGAYLDFEDKFDHYYCL